MEKSIMKAQNRLFYRILIVGATSGIGLSLAGQYVRHGHHVIVSGRRDQLLQQFLEKYPLKTQSVVMDIANVEESISQMENVVKEGQLDLIIFCAGTGVIPPRLDMEIDRETLETNVIGFTSFMNWAYNYFKEMGKGHLVGISSIGGLRGNPWSVSYGASKAYQINYLEGLRIRALKENIELIITDVRPGFVDTAMAKGEKLFWVMKPDKVAVQIMRAIAKKKSMIYVTKRWRIVAYAIKWMPTYFYNKI